MNEAFEPDEHVRQLIAQGASDDEIVASLEQRGLSADMARTVVSSLRGHAPRSPWLAMVLGFFGPGLGHFYSGAWRRGFAFVAAAIGTAALGLVIGVAEWFWGMVAQCTVVLGITIASMVDAFRTAQATGTSFVPTRLNQWFVYLALWIAYVVAAGNLQITPFTSSPLAKYQAYMTPTASMAPTLLAGDRFIARRVDGASYENQRGDILVFRYPGDNVTAYLDRAVAFGGETLEIKAGAILINGEHVEAQWAGIIRATPDAHRVYFGPVEVPQGTIFVLGDWIATASDSRVFDAVPRDNLLAVAKYIYYSEHFGRIGRGIRPGDDVQEYIDATKRPVVAETTGPDNLIPVGKVYADVMDVTVSAEALALTRKFQEGTKENPEWFREYTANAPPGPLPYHPNMGVTEQEYARMLELAADFGLTKVDEAELVFKRVNDARIIIEADGQMTPLNGVEIDLDGDRVKTPHGETGPHELIDANPEGQLTSGPWRGVQWSLEKLDEEIQSGKAVGLAFGRFLDDDLGILYYRTQWVEGGVELERISIVLHYRLPPLGSPSAAR